MTGSAQPHRDGSASSLTMTLAICSALLVEGMSSSSINVQVGAIRHDMGLDNAQLQLVAGSFLIAYAAFLPVAGRLVDIRDKRRVFQAGILLFSLGCVVCAAAGGSWTLILGRVIQGVGAALSTPAAFALITSGLPPGRLRNRAIGIFSAMGSIGFSLGLVVPGLVVADLGWRLSFLLYLPLTVAVLVVTMRLAAADVDAEGKADIVSALALTAALMLLVSAVGGIGTAPLVSIAVQLTGAAACVLAYRHRSGRGGHLIPLDVWRSPRVISNCLALAAVFAGIVTSMYLLSLALQAQRGYDAFDAGLALVPQSIANAAAATLGARLVTRAGAARVLAGGMALITGSLVYLGLIGFDQPYATGILPAIVVIGVGVAMCYPAASIGAVDGVPSAQRGVTSGLLIMFQNIGGAFGLALATATEVVPTPGQATDTAVGMFVSAAFLVAGGSVAFAIGHRASSRSAARLHDGDVDPAHITEGTR